MRRRVAATFSGGWKPSIKTFAIEQAIRDYLITLIFDNHFERFPNLRIASVEERCPVSPDLIRNSGRRPTRCRATGRKTRWRRSASRMDQPFWGRRLRGRRVRGSHRVIFGSDWPHIEALPSPWLREGTEGLRCRRPAPDPQRQRTGADHPQAHLNGPPTDPGRQHVPARCQCP